MKYCIYLLCICTTVNLHSQESESIQNAYQNYFELPRETLYTHLNKTTFIAGEDIWFKTYAFDRHQNLPSKATTNINVGIYDETGQLIKNNLWLATNGGANGNFFIDSTFVTGNYYIKASTNWMKNFEENDHFIQKIKIIANDFKEEQVIKENTYDFQFLPEGGYLVYDVNNTLGFKIINSNSKGIKISGTIYNNNNQEITTFKSNDFGIGKCLFKPTFGESYIAKIILPNGAVITKNITGIKTKGIVLNVNTSRPKDVLVNVATNKLTYNSIKNKTYTLLIHKDGKSKSISFSFDALEKISFSIPKKNLFNGITILTLFDEHNKPIVERLVYKLPENTENPSISINKIKTENDSLFFSLYSLKNKDSINTNHNVSISILPNSTSSYEPDHNILSATQLKPYIKGYIENPKYYFTEINNKKLYELDMLLLTQGWSRYNWNSIFKNIPKATFEFENGVTLIGKINSNEKIETLRLQDPKIKGYQWSNVDVKSDNTFEYKKYFPIIGETIRLAYYDKKGNLIRPNLYVRCKLNSFDDKLLLKNLFQNNSTLTDSPLPDKLITQNFFYENLVELDEILIKTKVKNKKVKSIGLNINSITSKNNYTAITQEEASNFPTVIDLITSKGGFTVARSSQFGGIQIVSSRANTINGSRSPQIFLDDIPLSNLDYLITLPTSDVEGVLIDKDGFGSGINGANGIIRIYSRRTPLNGYNNTKKTFAHTSKANIGFTQPKLFYSPKYTSHTDTLFKNYGTIGWFPNINLKHNSSIMIKIPDTKTQKLNFYIEGFDNEGNLISEIKTVSVIK